MNIETPKGWRKGQTIFNFLERLANRGYGKYRTEDRLADPYHISDTDLDREWKEFCIDFNVTLK